MKNQNKMKALQMCSLRGLIFFSKGGEINGKYNSTGRNTKICEVSI